MAIAIDASSPALVHGVSVSSTVTTASFTPPAGALLVACVAANSSAGLSTTAAMTDTAGLTWTQRSVANFASTARSGYAGIYTALVPTSAAMTVTVTTSGSSGTTRRPSLQVYVVTGADVTDPLISSGTGTSATNNFVNA